MYHRGKILDIGDYWFIIRNRWGFIRFEWGGAPLPYFQFHIEKQPRDYYYKDD